MPLWLECQGAASSPSIKSTLLLWCFSITVTYRLGLQRWAMCCKCYWDSICSEMPRCRFPALHPMALLQTIQFPSRFAPRRVLILALVRCLARISHHSYRMPLDTVRSDLIVFLSYFTGRWCKFLYFRQMDWFLIVCIFDEAIVSHSLWIDYYRWCDHSCFPCSQWSSNWLGLQLLLDVSVLIDLITNWPFDSNHSDNAHGRIFTTTIASNPVKLTLENCIGTCIQQNFTVAGTEFTGT